MKRICVLTALMLLCISCAAAEDVLSGVICYPEGSTEETASYVYRYSYPLLAENDPVAAAINENYAYMVYDAESFNVPITGESIEGYAAYQAWTNITATITCQTEDVLSVLVVNESDLGDGVSVIYSSQTYPLTGSKAGSVTSLPYMLGILDRGEEADEWLEERQAAKAQACVHSMVWELIEEQEGSIPFYDRLDFELLCAVFYPEDDFYLNANGDFVFYIEPGTIAPEEVGVLTYTLSRDDILDEL